MNRRAGYSLFEVLIAFAIMSMTLAVLIPRQTDLLSRSRDSAARLMAQDAALSHLAGLGLVEPLVTGDTSFPLGDWVLHQSVAPARLDGVEVALVQITVRIATPEGRELTRLSELRPAP